MKQDQKDIFNYKQRSNIQTNMTTFQQLSIFSQLKLVPGQADSRRGAVYWSLYEANVAICLFRIAFIFIEDVGEVAIIEISRCYRFVVVCVPALD